ncbi:MAG: signal peptidase II [Candidatus Riflebacteria bacterium]|nr:signal peptidase II [Candidatus Riflebacteria bacterium]
MTVAGDIPGAEVPRRLPDEAFGPLDACRWLGVFVFCGLWWAALWPFFVLRNLGALMLSRTLFPLGVALVAADQLSKWVMPALLGAHGGRINVVPGILDLVLVTNEGAAFGLFQGKTHIFIAMALLTILIIVAYLSMIGDDEKLVRVALVCIMGGAIGNLIDRVFLGHVVDFIYVHYRSFHWPVFNLADIVIDVGVGLILIDVVRDFFRSRDGSRANA